MRAVDIDDILGMECDLEPHSLGDYESDTPRWCKGCGDHGVLLSIQQILLDKQLEPEKMVAVSGIGCSSRLPHYLRTYGFHGIHGRALPLSMGVKLARPDLTVLTVMGDGDCFSIGAGHWLHSLRYNPDLLVVVLDNEVYALTKNQTSPTSRPGTVTNTSPKGGYLNSLNPLSLILGVSNVSFLAQSSTWNPVHLDQTLRKAWDHKGLSFVRIMQRCPVFMPDLFTGGQVPATYLEHERGIPLDRSLLRKALIVPHDPSDLHQARLLAAQEDPAPMGLLYWNPDVPTYEDIRHSHAPAVDQQTVMDRLNAQLDRFAVQHG